MPILRSAELPLAMRLAVEPRFPVPPVGWTPEYDASQQISAAQPQMGGSWSSCSSSTGSELFGGGDSDSYEDD
jgi:hypothetical protein